MPNDEWMSWVRSFDIDIVVANKFPGSHPCFRLCELALKRLSELKMNNMKNPTKGSRSRSPVDQDDHVRLGSITIYTWVKMQYAL